MFSTTTIPILVYKEVFQFYTLGSAISQSADTLGYQLCYQFLASRALAQVYCSDGINTYYEYKIGKKIVIYLLMLIVARYILFPLIWILMMSFKSSNDVIAVPPKFIFTPTLDNYKALFGLSGGDTLVTGSAFLSYFKNSLISIYRFGSSGARFGITSRLCNRATAI